MPALLLGAALVAAASLWMQAVGWAIGAVAVAVALAVGSVWNAVSPEPAAQAPAPGPDPAAAPEPEPARWPAPESEPIGDGGYRPAASLAPRFRTAGWPIEVYQRPSGFLVVVDPDGDLGRPFAYGFGPDGESDESLRVVPVWHPARGMRKAVPTERPMMDSREMGDAYANAVAILVSEGMGEAPRPRGARTIRY